ncbi:DUF1104 domain-containing protein [Helicobacter saguini]|uniref:DUF1104 domain-containing protein n=1 Tax=Helicobacter saguini TaxID=1548018 RepID=A0A347VIZ7_9HELI|nr:DUF1104 domain-containing protein [Helicobacter saguini]MWV62894.1 DUF1104 domain-containing protein [Helicobacter saguini]MWV66436.1 DUF1104 domain-containing protein [Helicobacter saguini]MWV68786.1 DUF1104 domain-containing protein [Helicobacter saguini]MWV71659.1 DUF1104 domain-containing protein [Helicobacter saguini]TLD94461.1 DUF1104 domain-containing protein [Helicobacter saguini]
MKKFLLVSAVCAGLCGILMAEDYSKKSNDELVKLHGSVKNASDAADLKIEIKKRIDKMDEKVRKDFIDKLKASYEKNTENMSVKEFRAYESSVKKELKAKMEKLGIKHPEGHHHGGGKDSIKGHSCGENCECGHGKESKEDSKKNKKDSKK